MQRTLGGYEVHQPLFGHHQVTIDASTGGLRRRLYQGKDMHRAGNANDGELTRHMRARLGRVVLKVRFPRPEVTTVIWTCIS